MNTKLLPLLVVAVLVLGFGAGMLFEKQSSKSVTEVVPASTTNSISERSLYKDTTAVEACSYFQCLFKGDNLVMGYAELQGYYRPETVTGGGEENSLAGVTSTCDRFVVTGGSTPLINQFMDAIKAGNTLNKVVAGNLVINLYLGDPNIDSALVSRIKASTPVSPISLGVLQTHIGGKGAGPCTSIIRVLNDNPTFRVKP